MASFVSENVTAEKVDAIRRFERKKNFLKFLPAVEAFVAVLLLLYWLTPTLFAGEYLWKTISSGLTGAGIYIFAVVNVLIALIFSLSNNQKLNESDLYFQYVSASPVSGYSSEEVLNYSESDNEEKTSEGKTCKDFTSVTLTAGEARPMRREMTRAVSSVVETANAIRRKKETTVMPPASTHQSPGTDHQVYRRTRSERLDLRGDLRRGIRRFCDIDDLSSDEFRSTVETFIAGNKKMLSKE